MSVNSGVLRGCENLYKVKNHIPTMKPLDK